MDHNIRNHSKNDAWDFLLFQNNTYLFYFIYQKYLFTAIGTLESLITSILQISTSWDMGDTVGNTKEFSAGYFAIDMADRYLSTDTGMVATISIQQIFVRSAQANQV